MIKVLQTGEDETAFRRRVAELIDEANRVSSILPDAGPMALPVFSVETAPADPADGRIIFVVDGDGGSPCLAVASDGDWLRVALGAAITADE